MGSVRPDFKQVLRDSVYRDRKHWLAHRIKLWYDVFRPKTIILRMVNANVAQEKILIAVIKKWFCIYLETRWTKMTFEDMDKEIVQPLLYSSEEQMFNFLSALPSLRLKVKSSNKEILMDAIIKPSDTLLHIVLKCYEELSSRCLELFLSHGYHIDQVGADNRTALYAAVESGLINNFILLYNYGADLHVMNTNGQTPFNYAAKLGKLDIVRFLNKCARGNAKKSLPFSDTLHYAVKNKDTEAIEFLLQNGGDVNDLNPGFTPLMCTQSHDDFNFAELLLERGANALATDNYGNNFLHCIAAKNNFNLLGYLLDSHFRSMFWEAFYLVDELGDMPMHTAARHHSMEVFCMFNKYLIKRHPYLGLSKVMQLLSIYYLKMNQNKVGEFPLIVLLKDESIKIDTKIFADYLPCTEKNGIAWSDDLFRQVLHDAPQYAFALLESYISPTRENDNFSKFMLHSLVSMLGSHLHVENSLLASIIHCCEVVDPEKEYRL
ncbi:hypothetical protein THRCLA_04449 [Thraustotheca clavata]|uniref:Uncharacterized protein n=1 Tax=Thraustotheca clavata TaxID=74557 RepID=A0A1V9ZZ25_9STRA|nr:hypothetical protein THRCLA_04449 [Thraustotheca clavata]